MAIKERPRIHKAILSFCKKKNISIVDMFVDYPCSSSIKKQLKLMLLEEDLLDVAKSRKIAKDREDMQR